MLIMLALMSRAPALERGVGADVLARWHGRGGRLVISLVLVHAWSAVIAWAQSRPESTGLALWQVLRLPWLTAATAGTVLLMAVGAASARAARRRLSYERWHSLHLLTYLAIAHPGCLSARSLTWLVPGPTERDVYLCGSPRMADAVRVSLREAGLPAESLHEERFVF